MEFNFQRQQGQTVDFASRYSPRILPLTLTPNPAAALASTLNCATTIYYGDHTPTRHHERTSNPQPAGREKQLIFHDRPTSWCSTLELPHPPKGATFSLQNLIRAWIHFHDTPPHLCFHVTGTSSRTQYHTRPKRYACLGQDTTLIQSSGLGFNLGSIYSRYVAVII